MAILLLKACSRLASAAVVAGDPEGTLWLMHSAEACLTDQREASIAAVSNNLISAANACENTAIGFA